MSRAPAFLHITYLVLCLLTSACISVVIKVPSSTGSGTTGDSGGAGGGGGGGGPQLPHLAWQTTSTALITGSCQDFTLTSEDSSNTASSVSNNTSITLSGAGSGTFYSGSGCSGSSITSTSILSGNSSVTISFLDNTAEIPTLSAAASNMTAGTEAVLIRTYSFVYVTDGDDDANVSLCSVASDGTLSACSGAITDSSFYQPTPMGFSVGPSNYGGDANYVYIAAGNGFGSPASVAYCEQNSLTGELDNCNGTSAGGISWDPVGITVATFSGVAYAYVSDDMNNEIYQCIVDPNDAGSLDSCSTPYAVAGLSPISITFQSFNGNTYAYVTSGDRNVYQCSVDITTGVISSCAVSGVADNGSWSLSGMAFATFNGVTYAYISDLAFGNIWQCTIDSNGALNVCNPSNGDSSGWSPEGIAFGTFAGASTAFVSDADGNVYQCSVNSSTGSLVSCSQNNGGASWSPNSNVTFQAAPSNGPAAQLLWPATSMSETTGICGSLAIDVETSTNLTTGVLATTSVTLSGAGHGAFYSDSGCTTSITSTSIAASGQDVTVYFKDSTVESLNFSATATGLTAATSAVSVALPVYNYVADQSHVYLCAGGASGFGTCSNAVSDTEPAGWSPDGIAVNTTNGIKYAYVSSDSDGTIYQCIVDSITYQLSSCANAVSDGDSTASSWDPDSISFGTFGGTTYAYVTDYYGYVDQCAVDSTLGTLNSCSQSSTGGATGSWNPNSLTFQAFNGATYAYVGTQTFAGSVWICPISGGSIGTCSDAVTDTSPFFMPLAIAFNTTAGTTYAYVTDYFYGVYQCNVAADGTLNTCTASDANIAEYGWSPDGVTFRSFNGNVEAFVSDIQGYVYECTLDNTTGAFVNCTSAGSSEEGVWTPEAGIVYP